MGICDGRHTRQGRRGWGQRGSLESRSKGSSLLRQPRDDEAVGAEVEDSEGSGGGAHVGEGSGVRDDEVREGGEEGRGGGGGVELYGLDGDVGDEVSEGTQSGKDVEKFWNQERRARDSGFWEVD
ncbi:hypothetical protein QJS10_CPA08g01354 [Acorus calamus]|uniref:Uncharacterized protein n=1 Tax=Acorus calamus TaxID=4465 RepID=A0AAV9E937_ACOCL|nr:hypothetical protein QJS10_CPA08g01354 [Acorus calamus]